MRTLDRCAAAREIAYIPQSCVPSFNYTLLEVVMMGLTNQIGVFDAPRPEIIRPRRSKPWKVLASRIWRTGNPAA